MAASRLKEVQTARAQLRSRFAPLTRPALPAILNAGRLRGMVLSVSPRNSRFFTTIILPISSRHIILCAPRSRLTHAPAPVLPPLIAVLRLTSPFNRSKPASGADFQPRSAPKLPTRLREDRKFGGWAGGPRPRAHGARSLSRDFIARAPLTSPARRALRRGARPCAAARAPARSARRAPSATRGSRSRRRRD